MKKIYRLCISTLFLLVFSLPAVSAPRQAYQDPVIVGIVTDGPSTRLKSAIKQADTEIQALIGDEFDVRLPPDKALTGGWRSDKIHDAFATLYADPDVDIVIALGFSTATIAVNLGNYPKPTLAAIILDETFSSAPRKGTSSGINNLSYVSIQADFATEVKTFQRITKFHNIAILTDALMAEVMPKLHVNSAIVADQLDIQVTTILHDGQANYLDQLPADTDAVMIGALPRINNEQLIAMLQKLNALGIPSYSLMGSEMVDQGALVTALPAQNWQRRIRRLALQLQGVLLGENPRDMPVAVEASRQLVINMETARQLGISPSFNVLLEARTINDDYQKHTGEIQWTLNKVAQTVATENLGVRASQLQLQAGEKVVGQARAALFPQFSFSVDQTLNNSNNAAVESNFLAQRSGIAALNLSQILYSEAIFANLDISRAQQVVRAASTRQTILDAVQSGTVAFLNVLNARSQRDVTRQTLELSRSNLELAEDRSRVGISSNADVYRWQSEVANNKTSLLAASATLLQSKENLNQLLNRPLTENFSLLPASLEDSSLIIADPALVNLIKNSDQFNRLGQVFIVDGLTSSPELAILEAQIVQQKRLLKSSRRTRISPTVSLTGSLNTSYDDSLSGGASTEGDDNWRVGINISLPIFEGGAISHQISENRLTLQQLQLQLDNTRRTTEQRIRAALHTARASNLSIDLNQAAATAARKNLNLVSDAYSKGAAGVIDLVDAQNTSASADLRAAQSVYQFLVDLMNLQRSAGAFDFFLDEDQRRARINALKDNVSGK